jgi:hypothetical protein
MTVIKHVKARNSLADIGNNPAFFDKATKFGTEVATVLNFDLKIVGT